MLKLNDLLNRVSVMSTEGVNESAQHRMDRRKKRTSTNQYMLYIEMMEKDTVFASGRIPRDYDANYLHRKWRELSDKLNSCNNGPTLTAEEWRKVIAIYSPLYSTLYSIGN